MKLLGNDFSYDVCPKTMTGQIKIRLQAADNSIQKRPHKLARSQKNQWRCKVLKIIVETVGLEPMTS